MSLYPYIVMNQEGLSQLKESIIFLVRITSDTHKLAAFLQPHLQRIDNPHLHHFHSCLQHKTQGFYVFSTVINQIAIDCRTNAALRELMEQFTSTF